MAMDFEDMLTKIKDRQWALADIDWDGPGAETISPELHAKLKPFMSDLMWIGNVGARGFAAMALKAPNETLAEIYRYFHAEEQKHANAELALMRRWGMLDGDEMPEPNINVKLVIDESALRWQVEQPWAEGIRSLPGAAPVLAAAHIARQELEEARPSARPADLAGRFRRLRAAPSGSAPTLPVATTAKLVALGLPPAKELGTGVHDYGRAEGERRKP